MPPIEDADLRRSADVLVRTALRIGAGERFVVVGDLESQPIVSALEVAARDASAEVSALRIDLLRSTSTNHSGERPHKVLPDAVRRSMLAAQASAFVASAPHGESSMREQLLHIVGACRLRHAHLPAVTELAFARGLTTDFHTIAEWGRSLERALDTAKEITSESAEGTNLRLRAPRTWIERLGQVAAGDVVKFPAGSLVAHPEGISGTFAATASIGEFFGAREGLLSEPVLFTIEDGRVTAVSAPKSPHLVKDIESILGAFPNSDRVGLVVLGVNRGIVEATGEVCVDQNRPGLHLVFGDPLPKITGATWTARTSFAACQARGEIRIDGQLVA